MKKYILVFILLGELLASCQEPQYLTTSGAVFGTRYNITYESEQDLLPEIRQMLDDVDNSLSPFNENSIISKINNNEETTLNKHFVNVFKMAMKVAEDSDGAFDITVAPLTNAWGFGFKDEQRPTDEQLDSIRQFIGYKTVELIDGKIVKQNPKTMLDCSAIAKGYGVDAVAQMLREKGVENFLVEIGGEVVTQGVNPKGKPWRVGVMKPVDDPMNESHEMQEVLNVKDRAMATSGNYRNFYVAEDGKRYAHTIDPRTGYPVQHNILSATVLGPSCAIADAYATVFMVLGLEDSKKVLERHPELQVYLIYTDDNGNYKVWENTDAN